MNRRESVFTGTLRTMPGFIGNYQLKHTGQDDKRVFNTLACKLVRNFAGNDQLSPPIPRINGTIVVFSANTGELRAIVGGTEITAWCTAAVVVVASNYLFLQRSNVVRDNPKQVAIIGCGVQVRLCYKYNTRITYIRITFIRNILGKNSCNWHVFNVQYCTDTFMESYEITC